MTAAQLWNALFLSRAPTLIHGSSWSRVLSALERRTGRGKRALDLRRGPALTRHSLRLELVRRWTEDATLVMVLPEQTDEELLPIVFEATRRAYHLRPGDVRRFADDRKLIVFVASLRDRALAALFPLQIEADRLAAAEVAR
jgi:hypothetical protein